MGQALVSGLWACLGCLWGVLRTWWVMGVLWGVWVRWLAPARRVYRGPTRLRETSPGLVRVGRVPGIEKGPRVRSRGLDQCLYVCPFSDMAVTGRSLQLADLRVKLNGVQVA